MTFKDLAGDTATWLDGSGQSATVVVSSRVRLARNLDQIPFTNRATEAEQQAVVDAVASAPSPSMVFFRTTDLTELERQLLVERHLISPALAEEKGARGVLVEPGECLSVMVNEEDHLRIQSILSGFQPDEAWVAARKLEAGLADRLKFAESDRWGYLTACATNAGTGLRASVLIHLPGLVLTREMDRVIRGVAQMGFVVRGIYGEGTASAGNLYQISNQLTMGKAEEALLNDLRSVVDELIACEINARETLLREAETQIEDKVGRALGILRNARLLTSQELMNFSSALRLGIDLKMADDVDLASLNRLMVESKPSHLQFRAGRSLSPVERDVLRAERVRSQLVA
ncbi:MAG: protein arginine kinase [Gemmatimonadetes bacterium]|nr:protein arginine kinase [Gemmatimonadota bacterium]